jgi:hypothetical protein
MTYDVLNEVGWTCDPPMRVEVREAKDRLETSDEGMIDVIGWIVKKFEVVVVCAAEKEP